MSAKRGYKNHAKQRARERYGLDINNHQVQEIAGIARKVQQAGHEIPQGRIIRRLTHTRSEIEVNWYGRKLRVIYNKELRTLVTILPEKQSNYA